MYQVGKRYNGLTLKRRPFFAVPGKVLIVCLQETRWTASTATNFLQTYPGFNIAHTPSVVTENGGLSGGVAILISCAFRLLQEVVITPGKLIAAQVQTRTDRFWVVSAYCHPNSARDDCEALARWLADHQDDSDPFFIVGDFNHGNHLSLDAWQRILNCAQGEDIVNDERVLMAPLHLIKLSFRRNT